MNIRILSLVSVAAASAALTSCSPPKAPAPQQLLVSVEQPKPMMITNRDEYPGHLEAVEAVEIRPRVSGNIDSIHFKEGAEVKAGDLLIGIDPRPYQAELDRVQAERKRNETRVDLAKNDLTRAESLRASKAISEEVYDNRSKALQEAQASVASAKAAEAVAKLNLDFTRIKAPISGRIGRQLVNAGNLVQAGGATPLATIVSMDPIYCIFDVDEQVFLQYRSPGGNGLGNKETPCEIALDSREGYRYRGHIDFIDNQINRQMGTIRLRAVFDNSNRALMPGLFAKIRLPVSAPKEQLCISDIAVCSDQGNQFVYVVTPEETVEVRPIKPGRRQGALWPILEGLNPADRVVVKGMLMLRPGSKVSIQQNEAALAAAQ